MIYFTAKCQKFLADLEVHNNREWFTQKKDIFKTELEAPFHKFVDDLILKIREFDKTIQITSKDAVFRIYRDVRFSKDKSPYKIFLSAAIAAGGRKEMETPGLYFEIRADAIHIYTGVYMPSPSSLVKIRKSIVNDPLTFKKLYTNKSFVTTFGEIKGDKNKVIPKEWKEAAVAEPLIYNKAFYYVAQLDGDLITSNKLIAEILKCYKIAKPLNDYFIKAMK